MKNEHEGALQVLAVAEVDDIGVNRIRKWVHDINMERLLYGMVNTTLSYLNCGNMTCCLTFSDLVPTLIILVYIFIFFLARSSSQWDPGPDYRGCDL